MIGRRLQAACRSVLRGGLLVADARGRLGGEPVGPVADDEPNHCHAEPAGADNCRTDDQLSTA